MHKNQTFTLSLPSAVNIAKPIYKGCVPMHTTSKRIELEIRNIIRNINLTASSVSLNEASQSICCLIFFIKSSQSS